MLEFNLTSLSTTIYKQLNHGLEKVRSEAGLGGKRREALKCGHDVTRGAGGGMKEGRNGGI